MPTCPLCTTTLCYIAHNDVAPDVNEDVYRCPDPDCDAIDITLVHTL